MILGRDKNKLGIYRHQSGLTWKADSMLKLYHTKHEHETSYIHLII